MNSSVPIPPAFPRMSREEASEKVKLLSGMELSAVASLATSNIESATYYQTAASRIQSSELDQVRAKVVALAEKHGFPNVQARGRSLAFDRELTIVMGEELNILPADAADEGVWSFLTLNVCPDIALWRFPNEAVDTTNFRDGYERLIGRPRNIFRRSWWRWYVLGGDLSSQLLEDESVGIMERPSIGGNPRLARAFASAHLDRVRRDRVSNRQDLLREAIKHLRRTMGQISIHALSDDQLRIVIDRAFDLVLLQTSLGVESDAPGELVDAVSIFKDGVGDFWQALEPHVVEVSWSRMTELSDRLTEYRSPNAENDSVASRIARDLFVLISRWDGYTSDERSVVHAAVTYFLELDDIVPDHLSGGLDDDDSVTSAAFRALGQIRD